MAPPPSVSGAPVMGPGHGLLPPPPPTVSGQGPPPPQPTGIGETVVGEKEGLDLLRIVCNRQGAHVYHNSICTKGACVLSAQ